MSKIGSGGNTYTGAVTINTYDIPAGGVTPAMTSFVGIGKNLVDTTLMTDGYYVNNLNGNLQANAIYSATGYIPVTAGTRYAPSYVGRMAWYDSDKAYISGLANDYTTIYITAPANAAYMRFTFLTAGKSTAQIEVGVLPTLYQPFGYKAVRNVPTQMSEIAQIGIGKNLVDHARMIDGYYVNSVTGNINSNATYSATYFIPVTPGVNYAASYGSYMAFYDANLTFISGVGATSWVYVTAPVGAVYARFTSLLSTKSSFQVEVGTVSTYYESYGNKFAVQAGASNAIGAKPETIVYLPPEICVAVGRTIEVYNKQVCWSGDYDRLHFLWSCSKGKQFGRKYAYTGLVGDVGDYTLTLTVYNWNMEVVTTATTTLKVVAAGTAPSPAQKVLCIGDSLTNGKAWMPEWDSLANTAFSGDAVEFVGTRGTAPSMHEGRSGWSAASYVLDTAYTFEGSWQFTVSGITETPDVGKKYTVPTIGVMSVVSTDITAGSGEIILSRDVGGTTTPAATGAMTEVATDGIGDASITYSAIYCTTRNPFWIGGKVDFTAYETANSITPDAIQIMLGTNGIALDATLNATNIKTLIDAARTAWSNIPIYIVHAIYYGPQDGLGAAYGAGTYWQLMQDRMVMNLAVKLYSLLSAYTKLYFVPCMLTMDAEYNFGAVNTAVNPRSAITVPMASTAVHPLEAGYLQMADSMFSTWLAHYADA